VTFCVQRLTPAFFGSGTAPPAGIACIARRDEFVRIELARDDLPVLARPRHLPFIALIEPNDVTESPPSRRGRREGIVAFASAGIVVGCSRSRRAVLALK